MIRCQLRKSFILTFCLALICGMFPSYPSTAEAKELEILVTNHDFEEPIQIPGWDVITGQAAISSNQSFETNQSLLLLSKENAVAVTSDPFEVKEGAYTLTAQLYIDSFTSGELNYGLYFYNANGDLLSDQIAAISPTPMKEWVEINLDAQAPLDAASAKIFFKSDNTAQFISYIDQIQMTDESEQRIEIENHNFENAVIIPGWMTTGNSITVMPHENSNYLRIHDYSDQVQVQAKTEQFPITGDQRYHVSAKMNVIEQSHSVEFAISFYNEKNERVAFKNELHRGKAGLGWIDIELEESAPSNAVTMQIAFNSGAISLTDVYIDNVAVTIVNEDEDEPPAEEISDKIINPGFELPLTEDGNIPGWTPENNANGITIGTDTFYEGKQSMHFHDSSDTNGLRVLSDKIAVSPEKSYLAKVNTNVINQTHNIVLEVHYYNENDKEIAIKQELFGNLPKEQWSEIKLLSEAPADASYARLAFYSGGISLTEVYFDNVTFELDAQEELVLNRTYKAPVNLGEMVHVQLGQAAAIQQNTQGENEIYYHSNGLPGTFSVLDAETGELKFSEVIKGTEALWAMTVGPDQNVYFASTGDGKLYRYIPADKKVEELGVNPSDDWVWDLEASSDGKIYGSTYPNASVFEYDIASGTFRDYGPIVDDEDYARGIAISDEFIFVGIGATKHLYKVNRVTGDKEEIIIEGYSGEEGFFEDIHLINDKLFVSNGSINMLVIDPETLEVLDTFQYSNMISMPAKNEPNTVYYKFETQFFSYDLQSNTSTLIENIPLLPDTVRVKDMQWITLKTGKTVLAMITQYGEYMHYDPIKNELNFIELNIASQSVAIQALETGHDGRLYMGGYQRGMSIYDPFKEKIEVNISSFAQPEGIGFLNNKAYYGTYVGAIMYSYDPLKPVDLNENPRFEYDIEDQQDRPFAITSGDNQLFVGTVPDYGVLGGALAIYDASTDKWSQYRNIVQDQSIISLAYRDGKLYGGTSVWGGLGMDPKAKEAKIFVWDVEKGEKMKEFTPQIPGIDETPRMIGELSFGPDGNLWGAVDGTIFAMDPETMEVVKSKLIRPSLYNSSKWFPYRLQWAPDGMLYTTLSRSLIAIDPDTLAHKIIVDDFMNNMTIGVDGSIYYALGNELYQIAVPETDATLKNITINGQPLSQFSPGVTNYRISDDPTNNLTVEASQSGAQVEILPLDSANKRTVINVTATDEKSTLQYTIHWSNKSEDSDDEDNDDGDDDGKNGDDGNGDDDKDGNKNDGDPPKNSEDTQGPKDDTTPNIPSIKPGNEQANKHNGNKLPNTATNLFNYMLIGIFFISIAFGMYYYNRRKNMRSS
ncbi:hypothetical protein [Bacillus sp. FJAT-50079]|uniref:hypothetical protein n=1 Tax=Bacillus sp. FJAT-50079 TaxID=2833577 RepID=UPI001BCA366E|nr:hypothetical protein [Bacillus sp. FJAT-50079]MBS4208178.1 hypothetical protein [Bacillus sp. FJAT-50079]